MLEILLASLALVAEVGGDTAETSYISLKDANGAAVTHLAPGTYTIRVRDLSEHHNFHLQGAPYTKVNKRTQLEPTGEETWTVTLVDGEYWFVCDPHRSTMRGEFTVGVGHYVAPKAKPKPKKKAKPKKK
jgi:plastocyanin